MSTNLTVMNIESNSANVRTEK